MVKGMGMGIICSSRSPMVAVVQLVQRVAQSASTVLITGETGTGKEVVARAIHAHSPRAQGPFVPVNCGAIPEHLLESEFFGHERGAFTGAVKNRRGRIAAAEGGTLFLDEVAELPPAMQVKLLRVLQERTYEPVGSTRPVPADIRVVCATHRDLEALVAAGKFRQDLYFRLFVCPIHLPPLRSRPEDVLMLFQHFWAARGGGRPVAPQVLDAICNHSWPGNVRELENAVEGMSVCVEGPVITLEALAAVPRLQFLTHTAPSERRFATPPLKAANTTPPLGMPLPAAPPAYAAKSRATLEYPPVPHNPADRDALEALFQTRGLPRHMPEMLLWLEDAMIDRALHACHGNRSQAAEMLGLQRTTLVEKLRRRQRREAALNPPHAPGPPDPFRDAVTEELTAPATDLCTEELPTLAGSAGS